MVLAVFAVTLLAGLAVKYGLRRFVAGMLLNIWFLIALACPLDHVHASAWAQALAWLIGSALALVYVTVVWLARGRTAQPQPGAAAAALADARHTTATLPIEQGVHIRVVQEVLGHTRVTTTERYTHVATLQMKDASERLGQALWGRG